MPPKAKFTKQQITEAGLEIIRTEGMENLTARALGKKLGSSSCLCQKNLIHCQLTNAFLPTHIIKI